MGIQSAIVPPFNLWLYSLTTGLSAVAITPATGNGRQRRPPRLVKQNLLYDTRYNFIRADTPTFMASTVDCQPKKTGISTKYIIFFISLFELQ